MDCDESPESYMSQQGRPYEFEMKDWLSEEEISDIKEFSNPEENNDIDDSPDEEDDMLLNFYETNPIEEKLPEFPENILQ